MDALTCLDRGVQSQRHVIDHKAGRVLRGSCQQLAVRAPCQRCDRPCNPSTHSSTTCRPGQRSCPATEFASRTWRHAHVPFCVPWLVRRRPMPEPRPGTHPPGMIPHHGWPQAPQTSTRIRLRHPGFLRNRDAARYCERGPCPRVLRNESQAGEWLPATVARQAAAPPAGHLPRLQRQTPPRQPAASTVPLCGRHASAVTCGAAPHSHSRHRAAAVLNMCAF
jgi:hypothetical protein